MTRAICLAAAIVALVGCDGSRFSNVVSLTGSGNVVTQTYPVTDFSAIRVTGSLGARVVPGPEPRVAITADDNVLPWMEVRQRGGEIEVRMKPGSYRMQNVTLKVEVTAVELTRVEAEGAAQVELDEWEAGAETALVASGASRIGGSINTQRLDLELSGASRAELSGSAEQLKAVASGASRAELGEVRAQRVMVEASGASRATVQATDSLQAQASGASKITYLGHPTSIEQETSGASSVRSE